MPENLYIKHVENSGKIGFGVIISLKSHNQRIQRTVPTMANIVSYFETYNYTTFIRSW